MSSLEEKAKTTIEIQKENKALWTHYFSNRTDERKVAAEAFELEKKWVSLEDYQVLNEKAQKEIKKTKEAVVETIESLNQDLKQKRNLISEPVYWL